MSQVLESPNWSKRKRMFPFVQQGKMSFLTSNAELPPENKNGVFTIITREGTLERARILRAGPGGFVWRDPKISEGFYCGEGNYYPYGVVAWKRET